MFPGWHLGWKKKKKEKGKKNKIKELVCASTPLRAAFPTDPMQFREHHCGKSRG